MAQSPPFKRILLKLSGEAFKNNQKDCPISFQKLKEICLEIKDLYDRGIQIGLVNGGGNIIRGINSKQMGLNRVTADYMGMLATMINGLALQDMLESVGVKTKLFSALGIEEIAERFIKRNVIYEIENKRVVIFTAGVGNPFFSTDTTAALRAIEINADILLKASNVDGLYEEDPKKNPYAKMFNEISYNQVIKLNLKALDLTAITMCKENKMPIKLFNINEKGNITKSISESFGTIIN